MQISGSIGYAAVAVVGAGVFAGGICMLVHACHMPINEPVGLYAAIGVTMAFIGGGTFSGAFSACVLERDKGESAKSGQDKTFHIREFFHRLLYGERDRANFHDNYENL